MDPFDYLDLIKSRMGALGLTRYALAQRLAEEGDRNPKSCNDQLGRFFSGKAIAYWDFLAIVRVLGGEITITWED